MLKGWVRIRQTILRAVAPALSLSTPATDISSGTSENSSRLSKTKIRTTGALAAAPMAPRTSGGPI